MKARIASLIWATALCATGHASPSDPEVVIRVGFSGAGIDGGRAIQDALDSARTPATILIPTGTYNLTQSIIISSLGTTLRCERGAMLRATAHLDTMLRIAADGVSVIGCAFNGNSQGRNGALLIQAGTPSAPVAHLDFVDNAIRGAVGGQINLRVSATNSRIEGNKIDTGVSSCGITIWGGSRDIAVTKNAISALDSVVGGCSSIEAKRGGDGGAVTAVLIEGNTVVTSIGFCVEAGDFGTAASNDNINGVVVRDNTCAVRSHAGAVNPCSAPVAPRACGGISLSTISQSAAVGNIVNAQNSAIDIGGIEILGDQLLAYGNMLIGDDGATPSMGISMGCSRSVVSNNIIVGWGTDPTNLYGRINLQSRSAADHFDGNIIANNAISLPPDSQVYGIRLIQNYGGGASVSHNQITNNTITGSGSQRGIGISDQAPSGLIDGNQIVGNVFQNVLYGIVVQSATNTVIADNSAMPAAANLVSPYNP